MESRYPAVALLSPPGRWSPVCDIVCLCGISRRRNLKKEKKKASHDQSGHHRLRPETTGRHTLLYTSSVTLPCPPRPASQQRNQGASRAAAVVIPACRNAGTKEGETRLLEIAGLRQQRSLESRVRSQTVSRTQCPSAPPRDM